MRLSPPQIESKLPAFAKDSEGLVSINIPFTLNRAVGRDEVKEVKILIKTVQTNIVKAILTTTNISERYGKRGYVATFSEMEGKNDKNQNVTFEPQIGQYYKIQLACCSSSSDNDIGYYSTVGVIKCTAAPVVEFNTTNLKKNSYEYTVTCKQLQGVNSTTGEPLGDITEKVYSYSFNLYDSTNKLIETSGEQIHNYNKDTNSYEQTDTWVMRRALDPNAIYVLEYNAITINGYKIGPKRQTIIDGETLPPNVHANLIALSNNDDGYIDLKLIGNGDKVRVSGSFILIRSSSEDNYEKWYPMTKFNLVQWDATTTKDICRDYSVQQGIEYQYAIQAYNSEGLYSNRLYTKKIICDFEDAFLYDGDRQLKIRFNPKISSFKSTILESKTNTIGSKYPFIFRNGNVEYKEFQISGLISILGDENNEFKSNLPINRNLQRPMTPSPSGVDDMGNWLTGENYYREREFKLQVMEWLNNGKPKLFRSPAEGNYIVRLMSVSLSPNDTLGRMLHTFTCSATEIAAPTFENFYDYGFITEDYIETRNMKINQINLNGDIPSSLLDNNGSIVIPSAYMASITADPFTKIRYVLAGEGKTSGTILDIGETGGYYFPEEVLKETPLISIRLESESWGSPAFLTYGYYDGVKDDFSYVTDVKIVDEMTQIPGQGVRYNSNGEIVGKNIIESLEDIRTKTGAFHYLRVETKTLQDIEWNSANQFYQYDKTLPVSWNSRVLYRIIRENTVIFFDGNNPPPNKPPFVNDVVNPELEGYVLYAADHLYEFKLDDNPMIDFSGNSDTDGRYNALRNLSSIKELYAGKGLILDVVYQKKEIYYTIEKEDNKLIELRKAWLSFKEDYEKSPTQQNKNLMDKSYNDYIQRLRIKLKEEADEYDIEYAI